MQRPHPRATRRLCLPRRAASPLIVILHLRYFNRKHRNTFQNSPCRFVDRPQSSGHPGRGSGFLKQDSGMTTFVYIDALNLYYGCLHGTSYKWLDVCHLMTAMLPGHHIRRVKYFTARVDHISDPDAPKRQDAYLRGLRAHCSRVEIVEGHFKTRNKRYPEVGTGIVRQVAVPEEKGSDVNLCVHLLHDAWLGLYDCAAVVTDDSDMAEALRLIKAQFPLKHVLLVTPGDHRKPAKQLTQYADHWGRIREADCAASQLPNPIPSSPKLIKPEIW